MLIEWILKISDHGDMALSKAIHNVGVYGGIIGGAVASTAGNIVTDSTAPSELDMVSAFVLQYGGLVALLSGFSLILKNLSDIMVSWVKLWSDRRKNRRSGDADNNP